jgi:hypothetical protein
MRVKKSGSADKNSPEHILKLTPFGRIWQIFPKKPGLLNRAKS